MSLTSKQEHVTTTCALCMISKWHKQRRFHSASPRRCLEFSLLASASSSLPLPLPCLASTSTSLPWPLPLPRQNCLEPIPAFYVLQDLFYRAVLYRLCRYSHCQLCACFFGLSARCIQSRTLTCICVTFWSLNDGITEGRLAFSIFYKLR